MEHGQAEHLEYILDMMSVGIAILDATSLDIRYINSYLYKLLDTPLDIKDVPDHCITEVLPIKLHEKVLHTLRYIATTGQRTQYKEVPYEGFLEVRGRTYWNITIELRLTTPSIPATNITPTQQEQALVITLEDVTQIVRCRHAQQIEAEVIARTAELKQRNQALQEAKAAQELTHARMSLLLERLPTGVILVATENAAITVINRRAMEMLQQLGASIEPQDDPEEACTQAIGKNCEQLLRNMPAYNASGAPIPYEEHPLHKALVHGQTAEAELQMTRTDGQVIHLLINTAPLYTADGSVTSIILVLQEITRIKTLERAREDFFTTMAHELKTPLANIRAHLSALLTNDLQWSSEEQHDFLQTADEQVERLVDMINQFLDASRVEAGALRLELEPLLIPELFEDLQDRLEALISSSKRSLHLDISPQLPAVCGDYELIISVLTNLLSNAFRYAPEGDVVQLTAQAIFDINPKEHYASLSPVGVRLNVIDRGPGISKEQQEILFTRFSTFAAMSRPSVHRPGQPVLERRHKSERWSPATGLGLYISRGIVEAHGSKLTLLSSAGQGTTFSFILPVFTEKRKH